MQNVYMGLDVEEFIFGEGTTYEESYNNVTDEEMNEFGIIECTEDPDVACYRIALENEQNHNAIMMAMLTKEYNVLESTGSVMVYEASTLKNFYENVKKQVQKFWAKVKGVFKKVMDQISSIVLSNKAFVKKYRAAKIGKPADAKSFTGYKYDTAKMVVPYGKAADVIKAMKFQNEKSLDGTLDTVRGILCGESGSVSADEFTKTLTKAIHSGSENTTVVPLEDFQTLLNRLENAADAKKAAKDSHKQAEKAVKGFLSEVKESKANAEAGSEAEKEAKARATAISKSLTIMSTALSIQTRAIVSMAVQDRKMANYYVNVQNKKGVKMESAEVEFPEVVLI